MEPDLRRRLAAIVGKAAVGSDAVVHASTVAQLGEVLEVCAAASAAVAPQGSPLVPGADVVISGEHMNAIWVDAGNLLLHAGGAASWAAIRDASAGVQLAVAGLPSVRSERAGRSVALGEISHRALAGLDILTVRGELISAGGRTLKDVVGYDLAGLALGCGDRLGLIVSVTLRLEPLTARTPPEPGPGPWRGDAGIDLVEAFAG
jgi:glycolate oxidase